MQQHLQSDGFTMSGPWLYLAELVHRVGNEYASAISALRVAAAHSPSRESQSAVLETVGSLTAFATAHGLMRPPVVPGHVDLAGHLTKLCRAVALARCKDCRIKVSIEVPHPILLDASRSWRAGLIVSELITNASRHAFSAGGGAITVSLTVSSEQVACEVSDDGGAPAVVTPGLGTRLVDSLAAELEGRVERCFGPQGTSVRLRFPQFASACNEPRSTWSAANRMIT